MVVPRPSSGSSSSGAGTSSSIQISIQAKDQASAILGQVQAGFDTIATSATAAQAQIGLMSVAIAQLAGSSLRQLAQISQIFLGIKGALDTQVTRSIFDQIKQGAEDSLAELQPLSTVLSSLTSAGSLANAITGAFNTAIPAQVKSIFGTIEKLFPEQIAGLKAQIAEKLSDVGAGIISKLTVSPVEQIKAEIAQLNTVVAQAPKPSIAPAIPENLQKELNVATEAETAKDAIAALQAELETLNETPLSLKEQIAEIDNDLSTLSKDDILGQALTKVKSSLVQELQAEEAAIRPRIKQIESEIKKLDAIASSSAKTVNEVLAEIASRTITVPVDTKEVLEAQSSIKSLEEEITKLEEQPALLKEELVRVQLDTDIPPEQKQALIENLTKDIKEAEAVLQSPIARIQDEIAALNTAIASTPKIESPEVQPAGAPPKLIDTPEVEKARISVAALEQELEKLKTQPDIFKQEIVKVELDTSIPVEEKQKLISNLTEEVKTAEEVLQNPLGQLKTQIADLNKVIEAAPTKEVPVSALKPSTSATVEQFEAAEKAKLELDSVQKELAAFQAHPLALKEQLVKVTLDTDIDPKEKTKLVENLTEQIKDAEAILQNPISRIQSEIAELNKVAAKSPQTVEQVFSSSTATRAVAEQSPQGVAPDPAKIEADLAAFNKAAIAREQIAALKQELGGLQSVPDILQNKLKNVRVYANENFDQKLQALQSVNQQIAGLQAQQQQIQADPKLSSSAKQASSQALQNQIQGLERKKVNIDVFLYPDLKPDEQRKLTTELQTQLNEVQSQLKQPVVKVQEKLITTQEQLSAQPLDADFKQTEKLKSNLAQLQTQLAQFQQQDIEGNPFARLQQQVIQLNETVAASPKAPPILPDDPAETFAKFEAAETARAKVKGLEEELNLLNAKPQQLKEELIRVRLDPSISDEEKQALIKNLTQEIGEAEAALQSPLEQLIGTIRGALAKGTSIDSGGNIIVGLQKVFGQVDEFLGGTLSQSFSEIGANTARSFSKGLVGSLVNSLGPATDAIDSFVLNAVNSVKAIPNKLSEPLGQISGVVGIVSGVKEPIQLFGDLKNAASGVFHEISKVGEEITFLSSGLQTLHGLVSNGPFDLLIGQNIRLNEQLLSTQTSLASTNKIIEGFSGKEIVDPTQAITALKGPITSAIADVRQQSLGLAGVTSSQLIGSFQTIAGLAGSVGLSLQQCTNLTTSFAAGLGTLGIPLEQAKTEIVDILQGGINQYTTLAKTLGITNEQVRLWRSQGTLYDNLTKKLAAMKAGNAIAAQSIGGVLSNIKEVIETIGQKAGASLLTPIVQEMTKVYDYLSANQQTITETVTTLAKTLYDGVKAAWDALGQLFGATSQLFGQIPEYLIKSLANFLKSVATSAVNAVNALRPMIDVLSGVFQIIQPLSGPFLQLALQAKILQQGIGLISNSFASITALIPGINVLGGLLKNLSTEMKLLATGQDFAGLAVARFGKAMLDSSATIKQFVNTAGLAAGAYLAFLVFDKFILQNHELLEVLGNVAKGLQETGKIIIEIATNPALLGLATTIGLIAVTTLGWHRALLQLVATQLGEWALGAASSLGQLAGFLRLVNLGSMAAGAEQASIGLRALAQSSSFASAQFLAANNITGKGLAGLDSTFVQTINRIRLFVVALAQSAAASLKNFVVSILNGTLTLGIMRDSLLGAIGSITGFSAAKGQEAIATAAASVAQKEAVATLAAHAVAEQEAAVAAAELAVAENGTTEATTALTQAQAALVAAQEGMVAADAELVASKTALTELATAQVGASEAEAVVTEQLSIAKAANAVATQEAVLAEAQLAVAAQESAVAQAELLAAESGSAEASLALAAAQEGLVAAQSEVAAAELELAVSKEVLVQASGAVATASGAEEVANTRTALAIAQNNLATQESIAALAESAAAKAQAAAVTAQLALAEEEAALVVAQINLENQSAAVAAAELAVAEQGGAVAAAELATAQQALALAEAEVAALEQNIVAATAKMAVADEAAAIASTELAVAKQGVAVASAEVAGAEAAAGAATGGLGAVVGSLATAFGTLATSIGATLLGLAALAAPIALVAAVIGAIGAVVQTQRLKASAEETEKLGQQTDAAFGSALETARKLKTAQDAQQVKVKNGIKLTEEEYAANKKLNEEARKKSIELNKQLVLLNAAKKEAVGDEDKANIESQIQEVIKARSTIEKLQNNLQLMPKDLPKLGNSFDQLAEKARSAGEAIKNSSGDPEIFKKKVDEMLSITQTQIEQGQITAEEARRRLSAIANNPSVEYETQIKAQKAITDSYKEESQRQVDIKEAAEAKLQASIESGSINDEAEKQKQLTQLKKEEIDTQLEASQKAHEQRLAFLEEEFNKTQETLEKELEERQKAVDTAKPGAAKDNALIALKQTQDKVSEATAAHNESLKRENEKYGADQDKLQAQQQKNQLEGFKKVEDARLKAVDEASKKAQDVTTQAQNERLIANQKLVNTGALTQAQAEEAKTKAQEANNSAQLEAEKKHQQELESLLKDAPEGRAKEELEIKLRESRLKTQDLTLKSLETEQKAHESHIAAVKSVIEKQNTQEQIAVEKRINAGQATEAQAANLRAQEKVKLLQTEVGLETAGSEKRLQLELELQKAIREARESAKAERLSEIEEEQSAEQLAIEKRVTDGTSKESEANTLRSQQKVQYLQEEVALETTNKAKRLKLEIDLQKAIRDEREAEKQEYRQDLEDEQNTALIALEKRLNAGQVREVNVAKVRADQKVEQLQQELALETTNKSKRLKLELDLENAIKEARDADLAERKDQLEQANQAAQNQIEAQNQSLKQQGQIFDILTQAMDNRNRLLQAGANLIKAQSDFAVNELNILSQGETSEYRKRQLSEITAAIKLEALQKEQAFQRESLKMELEKQRLAIEQEKIQNRIQQGEQQATIAKARADLDIAKLDPKTTKPQLDALQLKLQAEVDKGSFLQSQSGLIDQKAAIGEKELAIKAAQQGFEQRSALRGAQAELARSLPPGQRTRAERAVRQLVSEDLGATDYQDLRNRGLVRSRAVAGENLGNVVTAPVPFDAEQYDMARKLQGVQNVFGQAALTPGPDTIIPSGQQPLALPQADLKGLGISLENSGQAFVSGIDRLVKKLDQSLLGGGQNINVSLTTPTGTQSTTVNTTQQTQSVDLTQVVNFAKQLVGI